jgi:superfamily I DNA/RNA helicase
MGDNHKKVLTEEQQKILLSHHDMTIVAVAGSGKTSTIIEYAATREPGASILYLAFNRSVKLEAAQRFAERGLQHVTVETAHSLAYRYTMHGRNQEIKAQGYTIQEIVAILGLTGAGKKHAEYILANHINRFIAYFCNSAAKKVQELNYLDTVTDEQAQQFVRSFYPEIEKGTRTLLAKMDRGEIPLIHDFYLKKFQLLAPVLPYRYILFDEGQDASAAMLDVFLQQKATKLIVGDSHQQIYGWRYAVNSLEKTAFKQYALSASFRFPQAIADLATAILDSKKMLDPSFSSVTITGKGNGKSSKGSKATIARSNLGLLVAAINYITDHRKVGKIYFEGNIHSYTYANDGASLYDVLNLHNGKKHLIRDTLIGSMKSVEELEDYVEATEDIQLGMMIDIVREYGHEIANILKKLKELHTGDADKASAAMTFSTVHRAKGMEYDTVYLTDDFLSAETIDRMLRSDQFNKQQVARDKLNEEINLLYVAITRARHHLHIPASLVPDHHPVSPHITLIKSVEKEKTVATSPTKVIKPVAAVASIRQIKERAYTERKHPPATKNAYKPWTTDMDEALKWMYERDESLTQIAGHFKKSKGAIIARLKHLQYYTEE